jgi:mannose-6-phosphate isomerase
MPELCLRKLGGASKVAILGLKNGLQIVEETPYAELWIGTHPNGPSIVHFALKSLKDILTRKIVGDKVWEKFDQELPFLLKVSRYLIGNCLVSVLYL